MPLTSRPARAIAAACLVVVTLLAAAPAPAAALEPPRPLPGYRPAFVTETDEHPWTDCLWASGAMLLDKLTNGRVTRTHQELRSLARDNGVGSALGDLDAAYARLGIDLRFSPDGGERITWPQLLRRLAHGAGAVLLGDDSKLPRRYGRWDRSFWTLAKDEADTKDNHAVYIERYDRRRGRVWLMDPLARAGWKGEWISVAALRRFAWSHGGALSVAVTPAAKAAPYKGVAIEDPTFSMTSTTLDVAWGFKAPRRWAFPGADVRTTFEPADDPLRAAAESMPVATVGAGPVKRPARPVAASRGNVLRATSALPDASGAYRAAITVTDRRFGGVVARAEDVAVFVPGPRRATLRLHAGGASIEVGQTVSVSVFVANTGTESWTEPVRDAGALAEPTRDRGTRAVAHWIPLDASADGPLPRPVTLQAVPLAPGRLTTVHAGLVAPGSPGAWALVVDVVDDVDGSFAALGSAPAVQVFEVVAPPDVAGIQ